ncbi:MAG: TIGR01212 family radical SAM protein [Desulfobacterium sp.]|nr:TIGR01212 family radical SAM protein [Desulfobacterium sp.]MBU3949919.1 TIGR01212 family radical SAM protein [Pseudomonadota bacterium]MBU4011601.1 TIGR01212 family radical SAM protein [Pseudomonadota bacterium]MBU4037985.1 TIGR01212 family radical SAM protein [Pseudomonadota bacterium]
MKNRYYDLNSYFRNIFGCRVQKITVDAGLNCPNRDGTISTGGCIYCNARGSGTGSHEKNLSITQQLTAGKTALSKRYKADKFIAYFQSYSNTYASYEKLKSLYDEALSVENIVGLSIGTRPDCVNKSVLKLLENYTKDYLIWIEYGLQSANDETLLLINRGHDFNCFENAINLTKDRGIKICAHVILGLPEEYKTQMLKTAKALAKLKIDGIKLHLLYVVKGTKMEDLYLSGNYRCLGQDEYAQLICDFLELLPEDMVIQRLTGDPHRDELVAPLWSLEKQKTIALIKTTLENRNSWQGKFYPDKKI